MRFKFNDYNFFTLFLARSVLKLVLKHSVLNFGPN